MAPVRQQSPGGGWSNSTFMRTTVPMFGFVVLAWWGLSQLMESKLQIRVSASVLAGGVSCAAPCRPHTPAC
jgi:hypothetical protein